MINTPKKSPVSKKENYQIPPLLLGYTYEPEKSYWARNTNRLLALRLETNNTCNLRCRYCYSQSEEKLKQEIPYETLQDAILQGKQMGLESVVVIGGGEPTLYSSFKELIQFIASLDIIPVVFTNTLRMTEELAGFLYENNASVMGKLDSLRPEVQDYFAGRKGVFNSIQNGLNNLIKAGYSKVKDKTKLRLGVSFVSNKKTLDEIEDIWLFCRENNIFPNMEILTPTGRAKDELEQYALTRDEIKQYKQKILSLDHKYFHYDWLLYTPLAASGCLQYLYSMYITINGDIRPCAPTKFDENQNLKTNGQYPYNINHMPLKTIYDSELFRYVRTIDEHLQGKCNQCEHLSICIGCRGYAYSVGINMGLDPYEALRSECQQCFK